MHRLSLITNQFEPQYTAGTTAAAAVAAATPTSGTTKDSLSVTDNRTGMKTIEIDINCLLTYLRMRL